MKTNIRDNCSQRLVLADSPLSASLNLVMCNNKLLDAFSSCFYEGCSEILPRLGELLFPIIYCSDLVFLTVKTVFALCSKVFPF